MAKFSQFKSDGSQNKTINQQDAYKKYEEYKDMSKPQLSQMLYEEVAKQKAEGSFDYNQLETMVDSLQGMLPNSDYQNIRRILESLK